MNITVNDKTVQIFTGAKAVDAIRKYMVEIQKSPSGLETLTIFDKYGHEIDGEAPLKEGDVIEVKSSQRSIAETLDTPRLDSEISSTPTKLPFPNSKA